MSIKDLFNRKISSFENAASGSGKVESRNLVLSRVKQEETFIPNIDFASASNFAKFGSAKLYYKYSIERVYNNYPYDGSRNEKLLFELSSSYLDRWIFNNKYPKSTGYIHFSYGGWGTAASITDGYGLPNSSNDYEYIYPRGNIGKDFADLKTKPLWKTFEKAIVYDESKNRTATFVLNTKKGFTVEFWLKKAAFDTSKTKKEVILDLWNNKAASDSDYGRFTLELSGTTSGTDVFRVTLQSGSNGFFDQAIGSSTVTTSSLGNWKHYAFSFVSGASGVTSRLYVDGNLNQKKTLGSVGLSNIGGFINGYIGALRTSPSGSSAPQFAGKLSASLDEFRFWKVRRTSEEIYNNWHRDVGGGTNTDDANTSLGLYYKFNEGIVGKSSVDSVVLDYSGRIANGTWTGYSAGARNIGSAFASSSHAIAETADPIIRSNHPDVVSVKLELEQSGSEWDVQNTTMLYNRTVPDWIKEEDSEDGGENVKFIYQIISSYFDTLYSQISVIDKLKDNVYPLEQGKALPFAKKLIESKGMIVNDILLNTKLLERVEKIDDNNNHFEKDISEIKNLIYTNLYNNMDTILKSKGNEKSIRNTLRCFGIDDELIKLNVYTDNGTHYFRDKTRQTSLMKNYVSFDNINRFGATIFQTSSANNSFSYITGSDAGLKERNSAFTVETSVLFPEKSSIFSDSFHNTPFLSSSIFGMHQVAPASVATDYTWAASDIANFQVFVVRDKLNSKRAKFVLKTYDNSIALSSSFFPEVYANENWNLAVRVKPQKYPFLGNVVEETDPLYQIEFYGVNHAFGTVNAEFSLSSVLNYASGSAFMTKSKRFYVGAHRTNFTGSVLQRSDVKIGGFRMYNDYLSNESIKNHNLDPLSFGLDKTYKSSTMFATDMSDKHVISSDLIAINWDFETVSGSDSSGAFIVEDVSSGSADTRYGWIDKASRLENRAVAFSFPASNTNVARNEIIFANKKQLPEIAYTSDKVIIEDEERKYLIVDDDISDNFYSLEKSMSQVISDEILKMISSITEFNNLIGKATDRYRDKYKNLDLLRRLFYEKVEEDPDFDKFTRYYKWIDSSVSLLVSQLFPISARHSKQISDIIESHILERSKYQNKFPSVKSFTATESPIKGSSEMRYNWKHGHAPVDGDENKNQAWQKLRKERTDIAQRELLRKTLITERELDDPINLAQPDLTIYQRQPFALRRLSRPYRISQDLKPSVHGGINYPPKKDRDVIYHLTHRHGQKGNFGQPLNVVVAGAGTGSGINPQQEKDILDPNLKTRVHLDVVAGRYADGLYTPGVKNEDSTYAFRITELDIPVTIISESVNSGYNSHVVNRFDSGSIVTNIHSDTTSPTNHIPMQGPFAQTWVGGHQHRHAPVNRYDTSLRDDDTGTAPLNNLDNKYTRPEGWMLKLGDYVNNDGALGIVGPDYGGPYPDPARKVAIFYREERAKRPVNIKNIRYTTGSRNLGNFRENYELISAGGKAQNNFYLRKNPDQSLYLPTPVGNILPETTHPMSLFGQAPFISGNVFGTHHNNRQPDTEQLIIVAPVAGAQSSGSFVVKGREYVQTNDSININEAGSSFNPKKFLINGSSAGDVVGVSTGSSDTDFWNNFTSSIQTAFSSNYSVTYTTGSAVYSNSVWITASSPGVVENLSASVTNFSASTFSFAAWTYFSGATASGTHHIIKAQSPSGSGNAFELYVDSAGLRARVNWHEVGGAVTKTAQWRISDWVGNYKNRWVHIAVAYNSSSNVDELDLYINNVSSSWEKYPVDAAGGAPSAYSFNAAVNPITSIYMMGANSAANNWMGGLDESQWYNKELTALDVTELYNCNTSITQLSNLPSSSQCAAWWSFGEGSLGAANDSIDNGSFIYDRTGNGNHLTVNNPAISPTPKKFHFNQGIAEKPPSAIMSITASSQTPNLNATVTTGSVGCASFISFANIAGGVTPVVGDVRTSLDVVIPIITSSATNTIISSRFSAPGGIEIQSLGYLDVYAREYSIYNSLNYRNLSVRGVSVIVSGSGPGTGYRNQGGSGEAGTIRMDTHLGKRDSYKALLSRHCGKFGTDSAYGVVWGKDHNLSASFHKVHSNVGRRPTDKSTIPAPVFNEDHNNAHFSSLLPRSDFQYSWVTSSLGSNYSYKSGKQRIYGYTPADGVLSSSVSIGGDSGFVAAINFPTASEIFGV